MIKKINKYIEIVRAKEVKYSSMGIKSAQMIQTVLSNYYEKVGLTNVATLDDLNELATKQPDFVFLGLKRIKSSGEHIWLSEYLESQGINYSGSRKSAMQLDLNKADAKAIVKTNNLKTAQYFTSYPGQYSVGRNIPIDFPVFIKPHNQGGGMGIGPDSVAHDFDEFELKVQSIFDRYNDHSLIEKYLIGREFSVGVFGDAYDENLRAMPVELITKPNQNGDKILGQKVKSEDNERAIYIRDNTVRELISDLGKSVYAALGARDYGRIDIRMDKNGVPHFIEANLTPGIAHNTFVSYFTRVCELNLGMSYQDMILKIVEIGTSREISKRDKTISKNLCIHPKATATF